MSNSCEIIPRIKVGTEEKESKLFKGLLSLTNNRDTTKALWGMTKSPEFMNLIGNIAKDENGEPTLRALTEKVNLKKLLNGGVSLILEKEDIGAIDNNGNPIVYDSYEDIVRKAIDFNNEHPDAVADIAKNDKGYIITVEPKTIDNASVPNQLMFKNNLNNQMLSLMRKLGFDVKTDSTMPYAGIFDPTHAETTAEGLRTVIRIAKGEVGEEAFPEEFSHLMISGLLSNSLVSRLVNSLKDEDILREILGNSYEGYSKKYNGDMDMLAQEAGAKLLQNHIVHPQSTDSNLVTRLWNFIKKLFGRLTETDVDNAIRRANDGFARLSEQIMENDSPLLKEFDGVKVMNMRPLYKLGEEVDKMQELAEKAREVASKRLAIIMSRSKRGRYSPDDLASIKNLQGLIDKKKYASSCLAFLTDSLGQIESVQGELNRLLKNDIRDDNDLSKIRRISSALRNIKEFSEGYEPIIRQMMTMKAMLDNGEVDITEEDAEAISRKATEVFAIINNIDSNYKELRFQAVYNFLKIFWGEDKIIQIGKNKGQALTLEQLLKLANRDIGGIDRWVSSMSDASDPLLSLIDKAVKVTKTKRDQTLIEIAAEIRGIHQKFLQAGGGNTEFMFERDSKGNLTGRLISDYDFERFNNEREDYRKELIDKGYKPYKVKAKLEAWERKHLREVVVDEESGRKELVPIYEKDTLSHLTKAQRDYYDAMIKVKSVMESLIPERYSNLYMAVQIRNDSVSAIASASSPKEAAKQLLANFKDNFIRRSDDTYEFGEDKSSVMLDFSGKPLNRLPVYYTTPLEDTNRLSLDFTSSIMAYSAMAVNYNEMNKVVDALELTRDLVKDREVQQYSGNSKLAETYKVLHKKFSKNYTKTGANSNIGARLDDYFDVAVYNRMKKDQGTWKIGNTEVDKAKTLDAAKGWTGTIGLGVNVFSAIGNVTQGKMQLFIEAMGGEYFNYKNLAMGKKQYYAMMPAFLRELNSTKKTNKLSLLLDKFDALEEYYRSLREQGKFQGLLARIFGGATLQFMNNMGEHYLHSRTMLAILDNFRVKYKGKEISLTDAFEVEELKDDNGEVLSARLKLKDGVTKLDGSELTEDDMINLKLKIGKVNQSLNGAFSDDDKGAIHRGVYGRLAMQYRQWMPAHYNRRFAGAYYDAAMDQWREGYYRTLGKFSLDLMKDIAHAKFQLATHWKELTPTEKANVRRALAEISIFWVLTALISMMGPEKDKKGVWLDRMIIYNLKRMKLDTGASMPLNAGFFQNIWTIMQSPAASLKTFNNITDLIQFQNMFVELESGRYKGWSVWERDFTELVPVYNQVRKVVDIADEDYMFNIYNK